MLFLIRPILFRFLQSKGVKTLVVELLEAYCKSTDNTVDDQVVEFVIVMKELRVPYCNADLRGAQASPHGELCEQISIFLIEMYV